jgi:hypothetical protein
MIKRLPAITPASAGTMDAHKVEISVKTPGSEIERVKADDS